jgi:hypothetical protein
MISSPEESIKNFGILYVSKQVPDPRAPASPCNLWRPFLCQWETTFISESCPWTSNAKITELGGRLQVGNGNIDNERDMKGLKVQIKLSELLEVAQQANICTLKQLQSK